MGCCCGMSPWHACLVATWTGSRRGCKRLIGGAGAGIGDNAATLTQCGSSGNAAMRASRNAGCGAMPCELQRRGSGGNAATWRQQPRRACQDLCLQILQPSGVNAWSLRQPASTGSSRAAAQPRPTFILSDKHPSGPFCHSWHDRRCTRGAPASQPVLPGLCGCRLRPAK